MGSDDAAYVYNLRALHCGWCSSTSDDTRIFECPACGRLTCRECVYLDDCGMTCAHTTPAERGVVTRQDWND